VRLTHKELAVRLGVTHHTVDSWTRIADPTLPNDVNLERLATLLDECQPGLGQRVATAAGRRTTASAPAPHTAPQAGRIEAPATQPEGAPRPPTRPTNLPASLTSFIGREEQIREVAHLLDQTRVLTLTGAGGVGKTRLAIEVAGRALPRFAHGVWVVGLEALGDPALVPAAVAAVLGVREPSGRPLMEGLAAHLRDREMLLVLDNCEHLIDGVARLVETLLHSSSRLRILATSREALRCQSELVWVVPSLTLPYTIPLPGADAASALRQSEAGRLFLERGRQATSLMTAQNAAAIMQICRQLDGIPLALELAAAQVGTLAVGQIAERLHTVFGVLTGGRRTALPRQQTLRACIDWSYDLLEDGERTLLCRLGVFQGGWTLEAAEAICAGDGLAASGVLAPLGGLVRKSLVTAEDHGGRMRYRLLETVRQYALEQLATEGALETVRARHAGFFLALAEDPEYDWLYRAMRPERAEALRTERDNLRAVLDWSLGRALGPGGSSSAASRAPELGMRLATALYSFWSNWDSLPEGEAWIGRALAAGDPMRQTAERGHALTVSALFATQQGRFGNMEALLEESAAIWRYLLAGKDAAALPGYAARFGVTLSVRGTLRLRQGRGAEARADLEESVALSRAAGADIGLAMTLYVWSDAAIETDDLSEVQARLEESAALLAVVDPMLQLAPLTALGRVALLRCDYDAARARIEAGLAARRKVGGPWPLAGSMVNLAEVLRCQGDYAGSQALAEEGLALYRETGDESGAAGALFHLGLVAFYQERYEEAQGRLRESLVLRRPHGNAPDIARSLAVLAAVAQGQGQPERAARLLGAAGPGLAPLRTPWPPADLAIIQAAERATRSQLGERDFIEARRAGLALSLKQAVDFALGAAQN